MGLETDLPTIQNTKKERFDRIKSLLPPSLVPCRELRQSEKTLGCLCWRLPGTSGATWLHGIGFIFKMAAIRCKVLCITENNLLNPEFSHLFREYRLLIFRINGHLFVFRCVTEVLIVVVLRRINGPVFCSSHASALFTFFIILADLSFRSVLR